MSEAVQLAVRHLLTAGAGWLVSSGYLDQSSSETLIGAGMALIGVGWSIWNKVEHSKAVEKAAVTGVTK